MRDLDRRMQDPDECRAYKDLGILGQLRIVSVRHTGLQPAQMDGAPDRRSDETMGDKDNTAIPDPCSGETDKKWRATGIAPADKVSTSR